MADYWVSYRIVQSGSGAHLGFGTSRTTMQPPSTTLDVDRLSDSIAADCLPSGQHAVVMSWSRMGD